MTLPFRKLRGLHYQARALCRPCSDGLCAACPAVSLTRMHGSPDAITLCTCSCHPFNAPADEAAC